jgi:hypothetical protein
MHPIKIYKMTDMNDTLSDISYWTLNGLKNMAVTQWYDTWEEGNDNPFATKEEIMLSSKKLFKYLEYKGFDVQDILEVTDEDKLTDTIEVDVAYYHPEDKDGNVDETKKVYDLDGMHDEFRYKLRKFCTKDL